MEKMEIVAHRGSSQDAPENTLAAVDLAWEQRADGVEIDIHQCKSGEIVVMHDANTLRTTGFDGPIAALTLDELKKLDAGAWKGEQFAGQRIPTLDEVLAHLPPDKRLFIEIKNTGGEVEAIKAIFAPLKTSLQRAQITEEQIAIIGFNFELMKTAKNLFPHYQVSWLRGIRALEERADLDPQALVEELIRLCRETGIDSLNLARALLAEEADFQRVRDAGLKLYAHVENERHLHHYVNGFMTDCPAEMRALLAQ